MVTIGSLWLAILLSAVLVWFAGALVWMVLPHHRKDYRRLPDEDAVRAALDSDQLTAGQYNIPHCATQEEMRSPEIKKKWEEGPVAFITVLPRGLPNMGKNMALGFLTYLALGVVVAYLATRTLDAGADYKTVFRVVGTTSWLAYGFAYLQDGVWFGRPWSFVFKAQLDALLYALLTAGVFGWLWPGA